VILEILVLGGATGVIATTITKGKPFLPLRRWAKKKSPEWLYALLRCPYCTSHWVAFAITAIYRPRIVNVFWLVDYFITAFTLVAIGAVLAGVFLKLYHFTNPEDEDPTPLHFSKGAYESNIAPEYASKN
jgi:hypothetical protein